MGNIERPSLNVPEGVFLPEAVQEISVALFEHECDFEKSREEYLQCTELISNWLLQKELTSFRIGQLSQNKEETPDKFYRRFKIDTIFQDGRTEKMVQEGKWEIYWAYVCKDRLGKLIKKLKPSKKKHFAGKATREKHQEAYQIVLRRDGQRNRDDEERAVAEQLLPEGFDRVIFRKLRKARALPSGRRRH